MSRKARLAWIVTHTETHKHTHTQTHMHTWYTMVQFREHTVLTPIYKCYSSSSLNKPEIQNQKPDEENMEKQDAKLSKLVLVQIS